MRLPRLFRYARQNATLFYDNEFELYSASSIGLYLSRQMDTRILQMKSQTPAAVTRTIRRHELRDMIPLADTTIYDMEQRGEFPQRFYLTSRCVVWDLSEVEAWLEERRRASRAKAVKRAPIPDVQLRKSRPIKHPARA